MESRPHQNRRPGNNRRPRGALLSGAASPANDGGSGDALGGLLAIAFALACRAPQAATRSAASSASVDQIFSALRRSSDSSFESSSARDSGASFGTWIMKRT